MRTKNFIIYFLTLSILFGITPNQLDLKFTSSQDRNSQFGLADNSIVDLRVGDEKIFVGTSGGLSYIKYLGGADENSLEFYHYSDEENLPDGGNPALSTIILSDDYDDFSGNTMVVVSGIESAENLCGAQGTGISWSLDNGETWYKTSQPNDFEAVENQEIYCSNLFDDNDTSFPGFGGYIEDVPDGIADECHTSISGCSWNGDDCEYLLDADNQNPIPFNWGNSELFYMPANLTCNVTYDLSVDNKRGYIYTANFAGSLRRFKFYDFDSNCIVGNEDCSQLEWEIVPLPLDHQTTVSCGGFTNNYVYNAWDENNYNHRVYSVFLSEDDICLGDGDTNGDGTLNVVDVVLTVNYVLGMLEFDETEFCSADMNFDSTINVVDVVLLVNIILGID